MQDHSECAGISANSKKNKTKTKKPIKYKIFKKTKNARKCQEKPKKFKKKL